MNDMIRDLNEIVATILGVTPEQLAAHIAAKHEEARRRVEARNARYAAALRHMTDVQAVIIEKMEQEGFAQNKLYQDHDLCSSRYCYERSVNYVVEELLMLD